MRCLRSIGLFSLTLTLVVGLWLPSGVIAQPPAKTAVVVDGRPLFTLSETAQIGSQERAKQVSKQLANAIENAPSVEIAIEQGDRLPTILLDRQVLLTLTDRDLDPTKTAPEQAQLWGQQIRQAIQQAQAERSPAALQSTILLAVGLGMLAIVLHWCLGKAIRQIARTFSHWMARRLNESTVTQSGSIGFLGATILILMRTALWVSCALYIANLFPWTRQLSYQITSLLGTSSIYPILTLGKKGYSIVEIGILGMMLMGWVVLAGTLSNLFKTRILSLANIARGPQETITMLARYSLILVGSILLLQVWGIDISSVAILASALGLGIGLGLQNIAKNFSSGLVLVFERPIQVGDFIEVGKFKGTVERIGARSTYIRTLDYISIIVPNSRFLEEEVINWTHDTPMSRLHLPVGVGYGSDPKVVESALLTVAYQHPQVLETPPPQVMLMGFGDSALDFELLVWTQDPSKQLPLKSELYYQIHAILTAQEIEIPFPQRDVRVHIQKKPS